MLQIAIAQVQIHDGPPSDAEDPRGRIETYGKKNAAIAYNSDQVCHNFNILDFVTELKPFEALIWSHGRFVS